MLNISEQIQKLETKKSIGDIVEYVSDIFKHAIERKASDIHIEPTEDFVMIRLRIDGDFIILDKIHNDHTSAIVTRLKVLSKIKIDENKKPQDGKIAYIYESEGKPDEQIDIRLSTLPTKYGEKVVMRILRQDASLTNLGALGLIDVNMKKVEEALKSKYGIMLVAGPTGSGKSTSLFGVLKHFNPLEYNISTLEDPIEYNIEYVNQSQVKPEIGYTFASGLRTLVRQDPDIIMVGEIRDTETAVLAVEAALTGHLVLSTIHTNSATATIQRLINMGVEPFLLASAMKMVISQRLGKRICPHCKKKYIPKESEQKKIDHHLSPILDEESLKNMDFWIGEGCEACNHTGYKGRLGIHEVLIVEDYLEPMILEKKSANEMAEEAKKHGMVTIVQDALIKASLGITTVEEALKLI
ncbi:GspE/PulE family protein [Candidatus Gracilibacteria bacterium]|nr:GspE/PulE family protein [Candidatus Gracilibacteria bacterium]